MITTTILKALKSNSWKIPRSQYDWYKSKNASEDILKYTSLNGKTFGCKMEKLLREHFNMKKSTTTEYDHTKNGKTIEQKSARWGRDGAHWKWQHIEMKHPWDYLLICGLDYDGIVCHITTYDNIKECISKGYIKGQGKHGDPNQAYWFEKSWIPKDIFDKMFQSIETEDQLNDYIK